MGQHIAVVGLGQMGGAMAERLAEVGHDVLGYDINPRTRALLAARGVAVTDSIGSAVAGRTVILSSLPDPRSVRSAWLDDRGIVPLADPGSLCIELSTIDPATMREVGEAATNRQLAVIDCPVSGSPKEAREGKLVLIAGGEPSAVQRGEPLLMQLGETWRYTGGVGTAKIVKIVNNMMSMGNVLVASEAFALGIAAGVDPHTLYDVLSVSGGRSHHFTKRFPNALKGDFNPGFKMELGEKDLALAIELGRNLKQPTPAASIVREMMALALTEGFGGQDVVALLAMYQRWTKSVDEQVN